MENQQKPTETYTSNIYETLGENDRLYVDMRVQGYLCSQIAVTAKRRHVTVREWFAKRGRLYEAYQVRQAEHRQEYRKAFKEVDRLIKEGAVNAVLKLLEAVKSEGMWPAQIMAANSLLDRAGFKASETINATVTQKTDGAIVKEFKKIDEQLTALVARRTNSTIAGNG